MNLASESSKGLLLDLSVMRLLIKLRHLRRFSARLSLALIIGNILYFKSEKSIKDRLGIKKLYIKFSQNMTVLH